MLTINLTLTRTVFCKLERNVCSTQAMVCFWCKIWYYSQLFPHIRWSKQSKESNTKCFHWLKIIWQRIPNFKNFIFSTSVLLFAAASPSPTWRESRTYNPQHNARREGCAQGRMQGRGFGVKTPPWVLIFYKNFINCAKEIDCFHIIFAC